MASFDFDFETSYRLAGAAFGIRPSTTRVDVEDDRLRVRFGPWCVDTPVANVTGTEVTGPYAFAKTAGPAHVSLADRGMTCATNGRRGLCIRFAQPVRGIDPTGRIRHPGLTVTVADVDGLQRALGRR